MQLEVLYSAIAGEGASSGAGAGQVEEHGQMIALDTGVAKGSGRGTDADEDE